MHVSVCVINLTYSNIEAKCFHAAQSEFTMYFIACNLEINISVLREVLHIMLQS